MGGEEYEFVRNVVLLQVLTCRAQRGNVFIYQASHLLC